jgi:ATP sulfurylase
MKAEILCTIGPASMNDKVLMRLEALGVSLFRLNLSHTPLEEVEKSVRFILDRTSVPLCLDTEGAQIRTGKLPQAEIHARENSVLYAFADCNPNIPESITFYPSNIFEGFRVGDLISIDFNCALVIVVARESERLQLRVLNGGIIGQNKAVTAFRALPMPALTLKDREAIDIGRKLGIRHFALSFAHRASDVEEIRSLAGEGAQIISKIECPLGLKNLREITEKSDSILIDRGDLSREIPIERIPAIQKSITDQVKSMGKKVYVATNFLESMVKAPIPTRAEINDIYRTLRDGVDGLVLAAETAIGSHPIKCADLVGKFIQEFGDCGELSGQQFPMTPISSLVEPHGGSLIACVESGSEGEYRDLPFIIVDDEELSDCELIANGTYSPLRGFMDRLSFESVLEAYRLPDETVWTLPVVLQVSQEDFGCLELGLRIALRTKNSIVHSVMDVTDKYSVDLQEVLPKWFGTGSSQHPGVKRVLEKGPFFVGGDIKLVRALPSPYQSYILSPQQTRLVFSQKGWARVVGFHSRNIAHRGHEYIQLRALEISHADGLLISPVLGLKKPGDFLPDPILKSYEALIEAGVYPSNSVIIGGFNSFSRYAGPREAVFTALCRKNMGCSHFIVGRDHTGVGNFYPENGNKKLFNQLDDCGITPIFFEAVGYDKEKRKYVDTSAKKSIYPISGSEIRNFLMEGKPLHDWMVRPSVQEILKAEMAAGRLIVEE